jgi:hypothetical protein
MEFIGPDVGPPIDPRYCGFCGWLYWHDKWNQRHCLCTIESKRAFLPRDEKFDAFRAEWDRLGRLMTEYRRRVDARRPRRH